MQTNLSQTQLLFREAMSVCAAGVHVITTDGATGRFGITMTAVSSVTDEPPTLMLCVNRQAQIYPILQANGVLCVNVLSSQQIDVAEHFAGLTKLTPEARFEQHIWHRGKNGQLQVDGALAHLHGKIVANHEVGTHGVFYVQIDEIALNPHIDNALVYFRRTFGTFER
ncbi:4-hydroxyphenylacetate 3-monooxygenase, reductase component [Alysiella filiformis]|uniref:4-hydroxyphenylacetate 3-monooxygenase reductase component n=1 Tax=Alysiella filiformis DSM 16848 TaxID=1120981 RepID=A0A286EA08_9NEIS|nr:4-hydroxyphenylacetate 3-monooxygenase, reductase component [Alysiella filiformis]UBQ55631.1 4-hydroxyphenylacetate 3-monooxygenase, reductase component [Alysiella filiformis DSM 16848]SOD67716.1 flavin reductase (NADH) [Alysiella filiformis DSM 16848]